MWKEFSDLGICPNAAVSVETLNNTLENSLFAQERTLIATYQPANQYWLYCTSFPGREITIIRQAGSKGNIAVGEFPGMGLYGVNSRSTPEKKRAAAQLLNFWLNDQRSLVLYQLDQGVPGNTPLVERVVIPVLSPSLVLAAKHVNLVSQIATASPNPPLGTSQIAQEYYAKAQEVAFGVKTPEAAVREFMVLANDILARNRR
jgi:multiple sugar transport system substrate-binding protein